MDKRRMQRYYRAILNEVSLVVGASSDRINKELKVGYGIETTTKLDPESYYNYLEYTLLMFIECFDIMFDSDWYKHEGVSYTFLFDRINK